MQLTSLDAYAHVMLDMNGTFMFDFDNFGVEQDFGATYERLGYRTVAPAAAHGLVRAAYDYMAVRYVDPAYYANFPTVEQALVATAAAVLPRGLRTELVDTFASHEMGRLPSAHRDAIARLARLRPLSILSNLWAPPARWEAFFRGGRFRQNFTQAVYSSEARAIKPHSDIFERALEGLRLEASEVLYVGDSFRCDVEGALSVGIEAVWLQGGRPVPPSLPTGVYVAADLTTWIDDLDISRSRLSSRPDS